MEEFDWQTLIWDERAGGRWTAETRLLALYLLSSRAANRIGCYRWDPAGAVLETGLSGVLIDDCLARLTSEGFVRFDAGVGWLWMPDVLKRRPFADSDEVRRAMPELAAVPRAAAFHTELTQAFRASADRPGSRRVGSGSRENGAIDDRALALSHRLAGLGGRVRRELPGLPSFAPDHLRPLAQFSIDVLDYLSVWKRYLTDLVNIRPLRILGALAIAAAVLFIVFPGIDLGVEGLFFVPPRDFALGGSWLGRFFDGDVHYAMEWFLPALIGIFLYGLIRGRPVWLLTPKRFAFIALSIALGAGLLTNVVFKDSWGRARPNQIVEFGGAKQFSPPFMRSSQCEKNCSFVSGDASLATSFMAFAMIADRHRRRWWLGLGGFTGLVGLMRMARGSHFLSDIAFSVIFTLMVMWVLARLILDGRWREWPRWRARRKA
jgi:lipid A 4'-phosphatase